MVWLRRTVTKWLMLSIRGYVPEQYREIEAGLIDQREIRLRPVDFYTYLEVYRL